MNAREGAVRGVGIAARETRAGADTGAGAARKPGGGRGPRGGKGIPTWWAVRNDPPWRRFLPSLKLRRPMGRAALLGTNHIGDEVGGAEVAALWRMRQMPGGGISPQRARSMRKEAQPRAAVPHIQAQRRTERSACATGATHTGVNQRRTGRNACATGGARSIGGNGPVLRGRNAGGLLPSGAVSPLRAGRVSILIGWRSYWR